MGGAFWIAVGFGVVTVVVAAWVSFTAGYRMAFMEGAGLYLAENRKAQRLAMEKFTLECEIEKLKQDMNGKDWDCGTCL